MTEWLDLAREAAHLAAQKSPAELWREGTRILRARVGLRRCSRVGRYSRLTGTLYVTNEGWIELGERVVMHADVVPTELIAKTGGSIAIGDRTFLNFGASITAYEQVAIGRDCLLGRYAIIMDNSVHDPVDHSRLPPSKPVILEDRVWLGDRVTVLPGVRIGHDAVVGAGSVVTKDVPPHALVVGNPARVVKTLERQ